MKISKFAALKILAKHLVKKMGAKEEQVDIHMITTSLSLMLNAQTAILKKSGVLTDDDRVNVEVLEEKAIQLFTVVPMLNFPIGTSTFTITKQDVFSLINDLKKHSDIDEVIYLSYN